MLYFILINYHISSIIIYTIFFCSLDLYLNKYFKNNYYLLHSLSNIIITYYTINDVLLTYTDFHNSLYQPIDYLPIIITYSLHIYHIINYFQKLMFDDWLHHILMCGIALPIGTLSNSGRLLNHSLFYLTGPPGAINYLLLFLNRNGYIQKSTQKKYNYFLNLWIRAPGCIIHSSLTLIIAYQNYLTIIQLFSIIITNILTFWNGIYFMDKVVQDYALHKHYIKNKLF